LVSGLKLRFQFAGNGSTDTVYLDDITVTATFGTTDVAAMYDDGAHGDGAAGDGVFAAQIPELYLSNYATIHLQDELAHIEGVGDVFSFGGQAYSMRVWLDPDKRQARNLRRSAKSQRKGVRSMFSANTSWPLRCV
jgi:hypothetical protein